MGPAFMVSKYMVIYLDDDAESCVTDSVVSVGRGSSPSLKDSIPDSEVIAGSIAKFCLVQVSTSYAPLCGVCGRVEAERREIIHTFTVFCNNTNGLGLSLTFIVVKPQHDGATIPITCVFASGDALADRKHRSSFKIVESPTIWNREHPTVWDTTHRTNIESRISIRTRNPNTIAMEANGLNDVPLAV